MNYKCKCGNTSDFFIEKKGNNTGLYCSKCGKWVGIDKQRPNKSI